VIRILALKGAQIICHPSNLVLPYCQKARLGAAIQHKIFIITANRTGKERGITFKGNSQIISPEMKVLEKSTKIAEELKLVEIDPKQANSKKITEYNDAWLDRRKDLYKNLL
jgi:predicted amidohydrolase